VTECQVFPTGDLVIRDVVWPNNMGLYYCKVQNSAGTDVVDMFVYPVRITVVLIWWDILCISYNFSTFECHCVVVRKRNPDFTTVLSLSM